MSLCGDKLIAGTAGRRVLVWDLRNTGFVQQRRESSLKYQTRCIRAFPDKQGYVLSSIEGISFYRPVSCNVSILLPRNAMLSVVYAVVVRLCVCVCGFVCLFVCLSHSGIVSQRLNVGSCK